jgi:hypothetical protein
MLWISHDAIGSQWHPATSKVADLISSKVVGVALATLFRYWSYKRYVFRDAPQTS